MLPSSGQSTWVELGYQETKGAPGVFWNPSTGVELVLHVDDFLVVGEEQALQDLKEKLQAVYELKATIIGEGTADRKEGTYLGRTIRWQSLQLRAQRTLGWLTCSRSCGPFAVVTSTRNSRQVALRTTLGLLMQ